MDHSSIPTISCTHSFEMDLNSALCIECATCKSSPFWMSPAALLRRSENLDDLFGGAILLTVLCWFSLSYESRSATSDDGMMSFLSTSQTVSLFSFFLDQLVGFAGRCNKKTPTTLFSDFFLASTLAENDDHDNKKSKVCSVC